MLNKFLFVLAFIIGTAIQTAREFKTQMSLNV